MTKNKKTIACIIARTVSKRFPLKVLRNVTEQFSVLDFIIQRLKFVNNIDKVYLCTSSEPVDDIMEDVAKKNNIHLYRGSANAPIERMLAVAKQEQATNVIRITGDNVFNGYELMDQLISIHNTNNLDYSRIINIPIGVTSEIMKVTALQHCFENMDPKVSEYLLLYMFDPEKYNCGVITFKNIYKSSDYTLTVDTPEDLYRTKSILERFDKNKIKITLKDILSVINKFNISNSKLSTVEKIKMPYDKFISYEEFKKIMNDRISQSKFFEQEVL